MDEHTYMVLWDCALLRFVTGSYDEFTQRLREGTRIEH